MLNLEFKDNELTKLKSENENLISEINKYKNNINNNEENLKNKIIQQENIGNKLKNDNSEEVTNKEDDFPDTRDEQLKVIRKKYMEEEDNSNFNNENNDIENMENDDKNENDLNNIDLNEDNKEFEQNEFKSEPPAPFKV